MSFLLCTWGYTRDGQLRRWEEAEERRWEAQNPSLPKLLKVSFKVSADWLQSKSEAKVVRAPLTAAHSKDGRVGLPYAFSGNAAGSYSSYAPYILAMIGSDFINPGVVFLIRLFVWWYANVTSGTFGELLKC